MAGRKLLTLGLIDRGAPVNVTTSEASRSWKKWEAFRETTSAQGALFVGLEASAAAHRGRWLCASLALQALVVLALVWQSMTAETELPAPRMVRAFLTVAPMKTPPPPPPLAPARVAVPQAPKRSDVKIAGLRVPSFKDFSPVVVDLDLDWANLDVTVGAEHGVPGGVAGGVPGGLVGGPAPQPVRLPGNGPLRIGGKVAAPTKLVHVDPVYPGIATSARVEGLVVLEATIDGTGAVQELRVLKSIPLLDQAAVDAVSMWRYAPTVIAGVPVPILMTVTVHFALG